MPTPDVVLDGSTNGLGRIHRVVIPPPGGPWEVEISEGSWVPDVWALLAGARLTTATRPEFSVTVDRVDMENRTLILSGASAAAILQPGADLYFFDPNWNPEKFHA